MAHTNTLASMHAVQDAHGDVKPDNVLVADDGRIQVADPLGNGTLVTMFFSENRGGTPGYWAPEVRAWRFDSYAGDVYSYGATLSHLLTGMRPSDENQIASNSGSHLVAPLIRNVVAACCQIDANARPSMQEVLRILGGEDSGSYLEAKETPSGVSGYIQASSYLEGLPYRSFFVMQLDEDSEPSQCAPQTRRVSVPREGICHPRSSDFRLALLRGRGKLRADFGCRTGFRGRRH